jgi:putative nucleotidyltransferase with HDIG domain
VVERLVHELVVAVLTRQMHHERSEYVRTSVVRIARTIAHALALDGGSSLRIQFDGDGVSFQDRLLVTASLQSDPLLTLCRPRRIAAVVFRADAGVEELTRLLGLLASPLHYACFRNGQDEVARLLAQNGIRNIGIELDGRSNPARGNGRLEGIQEYRGLTSFLHDNHVAASRGDELQIDRAAGVVEQAIEDMEVEPSRLLALASYDDIDSFTVGHSVRVALLALQVARAAGLGKADLVTVGTAALLHDIGKSRVPQEILFKRGRLDPEEWRIMAQHPRLGAEILVEQRSIDPRAIGAAFCHHMTPDHGGYPTAMVPFEPSAISRLVRVCDVFEALTAARPYKKALTALHAYAIMHRCRSDFDPTWLRYFTQTIGIYPLGTRVLLTSGHQALVVGHSTDPRHPRIRLWNNPEHAAVPLDGTHEFAVGDAWEGTPVTIAAVYGAGSDRTDIVATLENMHCGLSHAPDAPCAP